MVITTVLIVAIVLSGLSAGIFLSFSAGVMRGLHRTDDATYVAAMRGINRGVINPVFLLPIFLSPFLMGGTGIALLVGGETASPPAPAAVLLLVAGALGLIGGILITAGRNVPLNNALDASTGSDSATRGDFERLWVAANHARTLLTLSAFVLAVIGAVLR